MKKLVLILLLIIQGIVHSSANDEIEIILLTCSSGKETFSAWGHSAIRVIDKAANIDVVYNFGLFDFNTPNFYGKFIKGKLEYKLGVHHSYHFYSSYQQENRQIIEQRLNISKEDKIKIIDQLEYLYRPENRYYLYSFVGKNCTTELRNLILENVDTDFKNKITEKTHREQLNEFLSGRLWLRFSMSLIMGYKVDKKIDLYQSMFLPDYLCSELRNLNVNNESIIANEQIYNQVYNPYLNYPFLANPILIFLILLILIIILKSKYLQNTVSLIIGITGLVVLLVSLITEHKELQYNLNLLWLNPLYILLVFKYSKRTNFKKYLVYITQLFIFMIIPIWIFKIQYFEWTYVPIIFILSIFNFRIIKELRLIS